MARIDLAKLGKGTLRVGGFKFKPWGDVEGQDQVYVEEVNGEAGTFPTRDITEILRGKEPAKALRSYYDENF